VPCRLANQIVADRIEIVHDNVIAACHNRLLDIDQVNYDWQTLYSGHREEAKGLAQQCAISHSLNYQYP
jgi:hypothetical protein